MKTVFFRWSGFRERRMIRFNSSNIIGSLKNIKKIHFSESGQRILEDSLKIYHIATFCGSSISNSFVFKKMSKEKNVFGKQLIVTDLISHVIIVLEIKVHNFGRKV
ncbi:hypothetical protein AVEN_217322-1 [Araneus ventricosus]|uniref:Uncharacterized protein n=1 Tax=Araneus ventricosus TaxID=182803 RepID=A0A4Y2UWC0_ARAVE|nr:hypothetical protein AVEN_217322-1 [Araneus ventricosus]